MWENYLNFQIETSKVFPCFPWKEKKKITNFIWLDLLFVYSWTVENSSKVSLTQFLPLVSFYTPLSWSIERNQYDEMVTSY